MIHSIKIGFPYIFWVSEQTNSFAQSNTGRDAPVITKMLAATNHPVHAVYNPQVNVARQRLATPVPFP